jgi:hypothetical protein
MGQEQKKVKPSEQIRVLQEQLLATGKRVSQMEMIVYNLSRENEIVKNALQMLHEKLDATITLANGGQALTTENIDKQIVLIREADLKAKIDEQVKSGNMKVVDEVGENSVVVSRELNDDGEVENPRLQFMVGRLSDDLKALYVGKKVGDLIKNEEGKLDVEISEIYDFVPVELNASSDQTEESTEEEKDSDSN